MVRIRLAIVTWIGNNDVAYASGISEKTMQPLFALQKMLYEAGARNFLFLNVPSLPQLRQSRQPQSTMLRLREERCLQWNKSLQGVERDDGTGEVSSVGQFSARHTEITVLLFDAHAAFTKFFADPIKYGLPIDAGRAYDKVAYVDHIHPTTRVHDLLAEEVAIFLLGDVDGKNEGEYS